MTSIFFDILLLLLVITSSLIGFMRGFTKEFFGSIGFLGAVIVTIYSFPYSFLLLEPHVKIIWLRYLLTSIGIFLPCYIIFRLISNFLSKMIKGSFLLSLDRTLGLSWGALRGFILMCFLFLSVTALSPYSLNYFVEARTLPWVRGASLWLWYLMPKDLKGLNIKQYLVEPESPSASVRTKLLSSMEPEASIKYKPTL